MRLLRGHPTGRLVLGAATAASLVVGMVGTTPAAFAAGPTPHPAATAAKVPAATASWQENLAQAHKDDVNVAHSGKGLRVQNPKIHPAASGRNQGYGLVTFPAHRIPAPTTRVTVATTADKPAGSQLEVDVRGLGVNGHWTEWATADAKGVANLAWTASTVQTRVMLWDDAKGDSPVLSKLALSATAAGRSPRLAQPSPTAETYRVFATREGLVGKPTANGHTIQTNDHFVALPSGSALSPNGSSTYSVQVCGPARCETAPVWDVGPWNTHNNYWDPGSQRTEFTDLAQGMPESQAAYETGYNGGKDDLGYTVGNRAGIDLADGTFADIGLSDNGWVSVTYLWTSGGGTPPPPPPPSTTPVNLFNGQCPANMSQGESDGCVIELQNLLNSSGAGLTVDGQFGPATYAAVRNYQASHGLGVDGVVGPNTKSALYGAPSGGTGSGLQLVNCGTLQVGSSGSCVTTLQTMLNAYGAGLTVDGQFGSGTQTAVENFQSSHGLTADGIVGVNTTYALNGSAPAGGGNTLSNCGTLQQGASGACVTTLQQMLNGYGAGLTVDGQFGPGTFTAVENFQTAHGLSVDGIVGPATEASLESNTYGTSSTVDLRTSCGTIVQGNTGNCVASLQALLNQHGASLNVDGQFGPLTLTAVESFQTAHGLTADGQVGPATEAALYATGTGGCSDSNCTGTVDLRTQCPDLQQGSSGNCVSTLQTLLNGMGLGYSITVDGQFGPATDSAVRDFQARAGLSVDGVVGSGTKAALYGPVPAPTPTGGNVSRGNIAQIALGQYGTTGTGDYCNPYGPCEYWCADFAGWVWNHAGVDTAGLDAGAISFYRWGLRHGTIENSGVVRQGDAIVFADNTTSADHVALVASVDSNGLIQEIGGDQGGKPGAVTEWAPMTLSQLSAYYGAPILAVVSPISDGQTHA
ncbi:NlpC/P60 family protein [Streptacidiphilus anmyonensis]|uniref:NlpC/P60 family protein n=1 Tax=Streptacidiphilus anmyonensis TaxID=405782 RepID=UPI00069325D8|nr:peptidoglycan-binding protein [Streptacidiphilus anmyonensis]